MNDVTISVGVSHTPWVPERVESMRLLRQQLGVITHDDTCEGVTTFDDGKCGNHYRMFGYREFTERAPVDYWAESMHRWGAEGVVSHLVFLQDDITIAPNFFDALGAMIASHPNAIIGLESVHPGAMSLARAGAHGYTTSDGLIGVGYVLPRPVLIEKLQWQSFGLRRGAAQAVTEDCLINMFAMSTGRRIWHPCPTIIKHNTALASTYGNDEHTYREPSVTWSDGDVCGWTTEDLAEPRFWSSNGPHLGNFYGGTRGLCKRLVMNWTEEKHLASERDVGPSLLTRWVNP